MADRNDYARRWRAENPVKVRAAHARYNNKPSDPSRRAYQQKWRDENRDRQRQNEKAWKEANREAYNAREKANAVIRRQKRRAEAIAALGGCCIKCGFTDQRALQFDHKKPLRRRAQKIRQLSGSITAREYHAIVNGLDHDIQLLCANCHAIKSSEDRAANWLAVEAPAPANQQENHSESSSSYRGSG